MNDRDGYRARPIWRRDPAALALLLLWIQTTGGLCFVLSLLGFVRDDISFAVWVALLVLYPVCIVVMDRRWVRRA